MSEHQEDTLRWMLSHALWDNGEAWEDLTATTFSDDILDVDADRLALMRIKECMAWTPGRVYFATVDHTEWPTVESVPRNPPEAK